MIPRRMKLRSFLKYKKKKHPVNVNNKNNAIITIWSFCIGGAWYILLHFSFHSFSITCSYQNSRRCSSAFQNNKLWYHESKLSSILTEGQGNVDRFCVDNNIINNKFTFIDKCIANNFYSKRPRTKFFILNNEKYFFFLK